MFEFVFQREIRIQRLFPCLDLFHHVGQTVIGLRADHQIDHRLTAHDFLALGLRHTSGNADLQIGVFRLDALIAPQLGINLFSRLFADVAGVQQNHIRPLGRLDLLIAGRAQRFGHALAVIDVHLTAIGFDIQLFLVRHGEHQV